MPESLIETRRRIQTIQSTEKITKAMKLVASVKYQRWKKMLDSALPYASELKSILAEALSFVSPDKKDPLFSKVDSSKTLYVILTSSLGLCGSYNYNVYRAIEGTLDKDDDLLIIGERRNRQESHSSFPDRQEGHRRNEDLFGRSAGRLFHQHQDRYDKKQASLQGCLR